MSNQNHRFQNFNNNLMIWFKI